MEKLSECKKGLVRLIESTVCPMMVNVICKNCLSSGAVYAVKCMKGGKKNLLHFAQFN